MLAYQISSTVYSYYNSMYIYTLTVTKGRTYSAQFLRVGLVLPVAVIMLGGAGLGANLLP